jgi:hypothetical protein
MQRIARYRPSPSTAVALAALVLAAGGVAFATIPDSSGTIHGCYQTGNGNLRVVGSASDCRNGESALVWNQEGPQGATGPTGPDGPPGGPTVRFDEQAGSVSTTSDTPVDLGGPSVTVNVGASGLVEVFGRADLETGRGNLAARVLLSEATDAEPPLRVLSMYQIPGRKWTTPGNDSGTSLRHEAGWLVLEATPGIRTFSMKYQRDCFNQPCTSGDVATFSNRKLWIVPVG